MWEDNSSPTLKNSYNNNIYNNKAANLLNCSLQTLPSTHSPLTTLNTAGVLLKDTILSTCGKTATHLSVIMLHPVPSEPLSPSMFISGHLN